MKRYKLLKDLPTFKAGQLAYISKTGNLIAGTPENQKTTETGLVIMIYYETTLKKFPNILTEWFEEIKEPVDSIHWKPKIGDRCFVLENTNIRLTAYTGMLRDYNAYRTGRVFRTEEECEKALDRELAKVRLQRRQTLSQTLKTEKVAGLSIMTMHVKRSPCVNLMTMMLVNLYAMRLEKKLKNPSKKTSKTGRFILELTRQIQIKAKCTLPGVRRKNNARDKGWRLKSRSEKLSKQPELLRRNRTKGRSSIICKPRKL